MFNSIVFIDRLAMVANVLNAGGTVSFAPESLVVVMPNKGRKKFNASYTFLPISDFAYLPQGDVPESVTNLLGNFNEDELTLLKAGVSSMISQVIQGREALPAPQTEEVVEEAVDTLPEGTETPEEDLEIAEEELEEGELTEIEETDMESMLD